MSEELSFEQAVELFDQKLKQLEDGELTLDQALTAVDEASGYLRLAQARLEQARQRIEVRPEAQAGSPAVPGPTGAEAPAPDPDELPF